LNGRLHRIWKKSACGEKEKRVLAVAPHDEHTLEAMNDAYAKGIVEPAPIGDADILLMPDMTAGNLVASRIAHGGRSRFLRYGEGLPAFACAGQGLRLRKLCPLGLLRIP
jgi:phosphotransacetylase